MRAISHRYDVELAELARRKTASDCIYRASLYLLILCSEAVSRFGLKLLRKDAKYVWGVIRSGFREADELYILRYDALLS